MKRLSSVAAILLLSVSVLAGNGPKKLSFCNTQIIQGISKDEIFHKAYRGMKDFAEKNDGSLLYFDCDYYDYRVKYHYSVKDCPNFGIPYWVPGGDKKTHISFIVAIKCRENSYTAELTDIFTMNPSFCTPCLYGENGQLYPEMYNRKQIKNSIPILEYISNLADDIFLEIKEYMTGN